MSEYSRGFDVPPIAAISEAYCEVLMANQSLNRDPALAFEEMRENASVLLLGSTATQEQLAWAMVENRGEEIAEEFEEEFEAIGVVLGPSTLRVQPIDVSHEYARGKYPIVPEITDPFIFSHFIDEIGDEIFENPPVFDLAKDAVGHLGIQVNGLAELEENLEDYEANANDLELHLGRVMLGDARRLLIDKFTILIPSYRSIINKLDANPFPKYEELEDRLAELYSSEVIAPHVK